MREPGKRIPTMQPPVPHVTAVRGFVRKIRLGASLMLPHVTVMGRELLYRSLHQCHGRKKVRRARKISVNIPAGIDNHQAITLRGEGQTGELGAAARSLCKYCVKPHKLFVRKDTIFMRYSISWAGCTGADLKCLPLSR